MSDIDVGKHTLKDEWQEAFVDPKVRDLVAVLNRPSLDIKTIASCEGHLRGVNPPYVYFHCPVQIAALIEKRLLLAEIRNEGLYYDWSLKGHFNKEFQLCWALHSYYLDRIVVHGNIVEEVWTCWLMRKRIDRDLALLAKTINDLLDAFKVGEIPEVPDPYDHNNHQEKPVLPFFLKSNPIGSGCSVVSQFEIRGS